MRYLAVDLGDKRTGLAVGDSFTRLAMPLRVVEVPLAHESGAALLRELGRAAEDVFGSGAGELVLGLPLNMDGTESARSKLVREFSGRLAEATGRVVLLHDERMTTDEAIRRMSGSGLSHAQKKSRRDAIAAAAILEDFLNQLPWGEQGAPPEDGREGGSAHESPEKQGGGW